MSRYAISGDTFTQSVSDSPSIMTTGNTVSGQSTATQTGSASYSFTQTTGDYELSGSGLKPYDVISHADANSGLADRTETGTDDYTLIQTGTSGTKAYTLTVTGSDDYSLTTNSNTQDGGFTQSLTATGSYSREEHGDYSGTPYTLSDADDHSFDQLQTGNDVDAQSTQTTTGNTRYDLLIDFTNPVESVTTGEGVTLFMAIGAPQALISDTAAPTGTMSDAGDIDHAYCFARGTLVLTADGTRKAIETITPNELVLAVDENDPEGEAKPRKVVQVYHNAPAQLWHVIVNGESIRTTAGHPFHVKGKGWIKTAELQPGDELRDVEGKPVKVESVEVTNEVEPVFNLQVEGSHTYFVGIINATILVHNASDRNVLMTIEEAEKAHEKGEIVDFNERMNLYYGRIKEDQKYEFTRAPTAEELEIEQGHLDELLNGMRIAAKVAGRVTAKTAMGAASGAASAVVVQGAVGFVMAGPPGLAAGMSSGVQTGGVAGGASSFVGAIEDETHPNAEADRAFLSRNEAYASFERGALAGVFTFGGPAMSSSMSSGAGGGVVVVAGQSGRAITANTAGAAVAGYTLGTPPDMMMSEGGSDGPYEGKLGEEIDPTKIDVYRGGSNFTPRDIDVKIDADTGLLKTTHGLSLDTDAALLSKFGIPVRIKSIPSELKIQQRGGRRTHFEIVPRKPMSRERYNELVKEIKHE